MDLIAPPRHDEMSRTDHLPANLWLAGSEISRLTINDHHLFMDGDCWSRNTLFGLLYSTSLGWHLSEPSVGSAVSRLRVHCLRSLTPTSLGQVATNSTFPESHESHRDHKRKSANERYRYAMGYTHNGVTKADPLWHLARLDMVILLPLLLLTSMATEATHLWRVL